jgi:cyclophilin family peptidyl-prolyl cis-trans isomerase
MTSGRRAILIALVATASLGAASQQRERPQGWYAIFDTTLGSFTVRLFSEQAPQTVAHFAAFAEGRMEFVDLLTGEKKKAPLYDGLAIHRVTAETRFEAGDPTGTGHGGPLVYVPPEPGVEDFSRPFRIGTTASSMQRISGAMFFVSMVAEPYLNGAHNCFGEVVEGRDVVEAICGVKTDSKRVPVTPVFIRHVTIVKSGQPPPLAEPVRYRPSRPVPVPRTPAAP